MKGMEKEIVCHILWTTYSVKHYFYEAKNEKH